MTSSTISNYPIYIEGEYAGLGIKSSSISSKWIDLGIANCNGCFSNNSVLGDVVLRGYSSGSFIITNEATGDIKFATRSLINNPSKVQMIIDKDGKIYGGDATQPSERDNKNSTFIGTTSIIVGPLGHPTGQQQLNKSTGKMEVNITKQPNGIVIYKNGTEQLRLTEKAVRKIIN